MTNILFISSSVCGPASHFNRVGGNVLENLRHVHPDAVVVVRDDEPTLDEILSDPATLALMHVDGVDRHELEAMLARLGNEPPHESVSTSNTCTSDLVARMMT